MLASALDDVDFEEQAAAMLAAAIAHVTGPAHTLNRKVNDVRSITGPLPDGRQDALPRTGWQDVAMANLLSPLQATQATPPAGPEPSIFGEIQAEEVLEASIFGKFQAGEAPRAPPVSTWRGRALDATVGSVAQPFQLRTDTAIKRAGSRSGMSG